MDPFYVILFIILGGSTVTSVLVEVRRILNDRRAAAEARKQRELEAANPKPICQCGHELAFHKPGEAGSTVCAATSLVQVPDPDDAAAGVVIRIGEAPGQPQAVVQACPCQQYVGPQAYPSFWVPEVP
mgnify:CR=1 FL=1